jgi:ABC-type nitrate/sulfonate/bicarbonate transport system substrate-binding protein
MTGPMKKRRRSRARSGTRSWVGQPLVKWLALAIIMAVAVSFYIGKAAGPQNTTPTEPVATRLRLIGPVGSRFAGEIVAAQSGLFKSVGLQVEIEPAQDSDETIRSVIEGRDRFGVADSISFLIARMNGKPVVAFGAGYLESSVVFYALETSGIHSPQDFMGKRVGRKANTNSAILYDALLKNLGLVRSNTKESATDTDLEALLNGKVDVVPGHVGDEAYRLRQRGVGYNSVRLFNYGIHVPDTVYFTTEKTIRDYPSTVQAVLKGIIAGWNRAYADPDKAAALLAKAGAAGSLDQLKFELLAQRDYVEPLGRRFAEYDSAQWKQLRDILMSERLVDDALDLSRAVNYDFLKEAYRKPITFGN